jgi:HEAT repeat protein
MRRLTLSFLLAGVLLCAASCRKSEGELGAADKPADEPLPVREVEAIGDSAQRLPHLTTILKRELSAHYNRAHLAEVLYDLHRRAGLESAYPNPIDGTFTFDLVKDKTTIREILEKLARSGGLELEFLGNAAVFWKKADDAKLAALEKVIKDERAPGRCRALEDLAKLGDKRIYPILFWAMAEGSEPMALAAMRLLEKDHAFSGRFVQSGTLRYAEDLDQFARGIERLLKVRPENERAWLIRLAAATRSPSCGATLLPMLDDPRQQADAVYYVGQTRDPRAVKPLLALLEKSRPRDPNDDTGTAPVSRKMIIHAFGEIGGPEAIAALRALAEKKGDQHELLEVAGALARAGDARGFEILAKALNERPPPPARPLPKPGRATGFAGAPAPSRPPHMYAVELLVQSRHEQAVQPLLQAFAVGELQLRDWLARFVGELRDPRFVPPLIDLLAEEKARESALTALGKIGDLRAIEPIAGHLTDKTWKVRFLAAVALLDMGDPRGKESLKTLLPAEDEVWHFEVLRQWAQAGDADGIAALVAELKPGGTLRPGEAANALGEIRDLGTIEPLAEALQTPNKDDGFAAAMAIGQMRHPQAIEKAATLLKHDDPAMRVWGLWILRSMKSPQGVDPLLQARTDTNSEVRQHASLALVAVGDDRSLEAALAMLKDADRDVRRYTAQELGKSRDPQVIVPLFAALHDADSFVRQAAAEAILATHDPAAIKRLALMASQDSRNDAGYSAARAFGPPSNPHVTGYKADPCVMHELIVLMKDADASVRRKAGAALAVMQDSCAIRPLIAALDDPDESVRQSAQQMLSHYHPEEPAVAEALKRIKP